MAQMDKWELILEGKSKELKACQEQRGVRSCLGCQEVNKCQLRDEYVKSVYDSMSRDSSGGFEF